ncbi:MAG TPA: hypothetical protein EYP57_06295 [Thermodesulfobacteriaceae bacterium]|nr:hypothetical protein [Thermodesulfobacteriaceae bacterium]
MLSLFTLGILPLAINIALNLPGVYRMTESTAEENRIYQLREEFHKINSVLESRKDNIRVISRLSGTADIVDPAKSAKIPLAVITNRLKKVIKSTAPEGNGGHRSITAGHPAPGKISHGMVLSPSRYR